MDVMLKLNRITLENTEKTHRMEDVSFHFPDTGLVLLAKYPQTFYLLLEGGIELHEIIIGGMGARENRKVLYKNICASDEELEVLKKLCHSGISVKIQIVPGESRRVKQDGTCLGVGLSNAAA